MEKDVLDFVREKSRELIASPTCCGEAKSAAQAWLDAVGTDREAAETQKYIAELEADIMPIDKLIEFAGSDAGIRCFGSEKMCIRDRGSGASPPAGPAVPADGTAPGKRGRGYAPGPDPVSYTHLVAPFPTPNAESSSPTAERSPTNPLSKSSKAP